MRIVDRESMQLSTFRGLFTLVLACVLGVLGGYLGQQVRYMPGLFSLPSGQELFNTIPNYSTKVVFALASVGFLFGGSIGPFCANTIVRMGRRFERASSTDKLVGFTGVAVGAVVTYIFYTVLANARIRMPWTVLLALLVLVAVVSVYLGIAFMSSMKHDLRTFWSASRGPEDELKPTANCKILDTNVIIDGRIYDVCRAGFIEGTLYVPGFVLDELQRIADSSDALKRARGRRGLDILNTMRKELPMVVRSWDKKMDVDSQHDEVDSRLVALAKALEGSIVTNDFNLNKVASLQGVRVLNVNELANALKPVVLPGEQMTVGVVKEGKEANQGVAYLDDGTMIVVEEGRDHIGTTQGVVVTSVLQTAAGKMIFARLRSDEETESGYGGMRGGATGELGRSGGGGDSRRGPGKKVR